MPQGTETHFAVIVSVVLGFHHGVGENECRIGKVHPVFVEVFAPFVFILYKAYVSSLYKCIYGVKHDLIRPLRPWLTTVDSLCRCS